MSETDQGQGGDQAAERLDRPLACWHESLHSARTDRMVSLSELGGFIETDRPLPAGAEVFLELHLGHASNAAKGEIDGLVVNNGGQPVGTTGFEVQFIDLDEAVRTWIRRHVGIDPQSSAVTADIPTRELAEAARARGDVPDGFEVAPSLEDEPTRSSEGFAIEQPNTLEYSESDSAPARPAPGPALGPSLGHQSSPYETTQRMYAAPGPNTDDEAPKPLPVSQGPALADGSGSAPSAPAQAIPAPAPGSEPVLASVLTTPAPNGPRSGSVPASAPAPVTTSAAPGSGPVVSSPKQTLDIAAAIEEISAPNVASPPPSAADQPSGPLPAAPLGGPLDELEIDETRPFTVAPAPKNIPAPLPIKVIDAEDVSEEGFDVEFSIDDGAPVEDSGPTLPAAPQEASDQHVVTTEVAPPSAARLSSPDDNLAGPNPAAPGPPSVPHTDPGGELPSIAVDLSDEDATETGAPTLQLEQALFGDLSGEADEGRARPLSSMMEQEPEPERAPSGTDVPASDLEAAFFSPDAVPPSPEEPITPAASMVPPSPSTSDEADDGLPAIELDAIAFEDAEVAGGASDNVSTLELPAGGASPDHAARLRRPVFGPPALPTPPLTTSPGESGDKPLSTPASQLLGTMPSSPGAVPKDAIQETQPFGVDASEIRRHLAGSPATGGPASFSLGEPATPPMGTPSPAMGKPSPTSPSTPTPAPASLTSPAPTPTSPAPARPAAAPSAAPSAAPNPAAASAPTDHPARRTLQFSAAAVQAELQRTSQGGTAGRGSTDPQFPAVNKPPAGLNPDASRPVTPAPSAGPAPAAGLAPAAGPAPQRTPTDQHFPAVTVPAGLPRAATMMEPEDVVEVNSTSQLVRVATDAQGDIQSIQSAVGPVVTGTPAENPALKLEVPDAAGGQSAVTVDTSLFAEPKKELNPFDEWSVLEKKTEDELPVVMGTDSGGAKENWVAAARPPIVKPDGQD